MMNITFIFIGFYLVIYFFGYGCMMSIFIVDFEIDSKNELALWEYNCFLTQHWMHCQGAWKILAHK